MGFAGGLFVAGCAPAPEARDGHNTVFGGRAFGTGWSVTLRPGSPPTDPVALQSELDRLDAVFSNWRADSAVSRFNASPPGLPHAVPRELADLVLKADEVTALTGAAFDITLGSGEVTVTTSPPAMARSSPAVTLDLSAIAKGYAADRLAMVLEAAGTSAYLVEVGGEVRCAGGPWRVGVARPDGNGGRDDEPLAVIELVSAAVATSGALMQPGHLRDPRRPGAPAASSSTLASVTVVLPEDTARADALATGLMVLGRDDALKLCRREGIRAILVTRGDGGGWEVLDTG